MSKTWKSSFLWLAPLSFGLALSFLVISPIYVNADVTGCSEGSPNGVAVGYDSTGFEQVFNVEMCLGTFSTKMWKYGSPAASAYIRILSGSGGSVLAECEITAGSLASYPEWSDAECVANVDIDTDNYFEVRTANIDASHFYGVWASTGAIPTCYTTSEGTCGSPTPTPTPAAPVVSPTAATPPTPATTSAPAKVDYTSALAKQILGSSDTSKWSGEGFGSAEKMRLTWLRSLPMRDLLTFVSWALNR